MKIAVVGNRCGWTYKEIERVLDTYVHTGDTIISGGAIGVDTYAEMYAKFNNITFLLFLPNINNSIPERYYIRNKSIAISCDLLIAFDNKIGRSGTKNTIVYAKKLGKPIVLIKN